MDYWCFDRPKNLIFSRLGLVKIEDVKINKRKPVARLSPMLGSSVAVVEL
jgi:hypothetical protein